MKKALKVAAAVVSLLVLITVICLGWGQLRGAISLHRHWHLSWLLAAVAAQIAVYLTIAAMFRLALTGQSKPVSPQFLFYCAFAFLFANRSLPGPAVAGVATLVYLWREKSVAAVDAQAAAASFYFADYAGFLTLIAAISVPLFASQHNHTVRLAYLTGLFVILVTVIAVIAAFARPRQISSILGKMAGMVPKSLFRLQRDTRSGEIVEKSIMELHAKIVSTFNRPTRMASYYCLSLCMHIFEVATLICGARSAGILISAPTAAAAYVAGNLASIISVLPGAVGFFEAGMIGTIHVVGHLSIGDSVVCSLVYRLLSFWAPLPVVVNILLKVSKEGMLAAKRRVTA